MPDTYPQRTPFFANQFVRLLTKSAAAQEIGADAAWLLTVVAHQEDAKRYSGPVTYWNEQLSALCGFGSRKRLVRVRSAAIQAGWLHYVEGGKSRIGRYWCLIPDKYEALPDGPCDEDLSFRFGTQNGTQNALTEQELGYKTELKAPANRNSKGAPFLPIPKDLIHPVGAEENESLKKSVMTFPTKGSGSWALDQSKLDEWVTTYPALDVPGELRRSRQWLLDNVDRQKTCRGMTSFLGRWLANAKPPERTSVSTAADAARIMDEHTQRILAEKRAALSARREGRS